MRAEIYSIGRTIEFIVEYQNRGEKWNKDFQKKLDDQDWEGYESLRKLIEKMLRINDVQSFRSYQQVLDHINLSYHQIPEYLSISQSFIQEIVDMKIQHEFQEQDYDYIWEKYQHSQGQGDLEYRRILLGQLLLDKHCNELQKDYKLYYEVLSDLVESYFKINEHKKCQACALKIIEDLKIFDKVRAIHRYQISKGITGERGPQVMEVFKKVYNSILTDENWQDEKIKGDEDRVVHKYSSLIEIEISNLKLGLANYDRRQEQIIENIIKKVHKYTEIVRERNLLERMNQHFFNSISDRDLTSRIEYYEGSFLYKKGLYTQSLNIFENIVKNKTGVDRAVTLNRMAQNYLQLNNKKQALRCYTEARDIIDSTQSIKTNSGFYENLLHECLKLTEKTHEKDQIIKQIEKNLSISKYYLSPEKQLSKLSKIIQYYKEIKDYDKVMNYLRDQYQIFNQYKLDKTQQQYFIIQFERAKRYYYKKSYKESQQILEELVYLSKYLQI